MDGVTSVVSPLGHEATVRQLEGGLAKRGLEAVGRIDHAANAAAIGLEMPPTVVVIFGNARACSRGECLGLSGSAGRCRRQGMPS